MENNLIQKITTVNKAGEMETYTIAPNWENIQNQLLSKGAESDTIVKIVSNGDRPANDNQSVKAQPTATAEGAMSLGRYSRASGKNSIALGYNCLVAGPRSVVCGMENDVYARDSAAFGYGNEIGTSENANATDDSQYDLGQYSFLTGTKNTIYAQSAVAMGSTNTVKENAHRSVTLGYDNENNCADSLIVGYNNKNSGNGVYSYVGGNGCIAKNASSFAHGTGLITSKNAQAVFGQYNVEDTNALFIIGNGSDNSDRSNIFMVKNNAIVVNGQEITGENIALILNHIENEQNPLELTSYTANTNEALDTLLENTLTTMKNNTIHHIAVVDRVGGSVFGVGTTHITIHRVDQLHAMVNAQRFDAYGSDRGVYQWTRNKKQQWEDWEWVNPPLIEGIEYRTTERFKGSPVYTQYIEFESIKANSPEATQKTWWLWEDGFIKNGQEIGTAIDIIFLNRGENITHWTGIDSITFGKNLDNENRQLYEPYISLIKSTGAGMASPSAIIKYTKK